MVVEGVAVGGAAGEGGAVVDLVAGHDQVPVGRK